MDIVERLRKDARGPALEAADEIEKLRWENANMEKLWGKSEGTWMEIRDKQDAEIERLRGALKTIDSLVPKTEEIADFPYWMAIVGDIAEGALNGTWPAYGVMPALAKEKE